MSEKIEALKKKFEQSQRMTAVETCIWYTNKIAPRHAEKALEELEQLPTSEQVDYERLKILRKILTKIQVMTSKDGTAECIDDKTVLAGGADALVNILKSWHELVETNAAELELIAEQAVLVGKQQAYEWDRFWEAMGVKSEDVTVDQAIEKYKALQESHAMLEKDLAYQEEKVLPELRGKLEKQEAQIAALTEACNLAYAHIFHCEDTDADSAERGAKAQDALEKVLNGRVP